MSYIGGKRSPFPYHLVIEDKTPGASWRQGFLLGTLAPSGSKAASTPQLVSSKVQDISKITPTDYSYSSSSPLGEREQVYDSLVLGMGQGTQETDRDRRYSYAQGVDASIWPICMGPQLTMVTPATTDPTAGVAKFFELGTTLYAAVGRYILRRDADATWTNVKDFGAGVSVLDVAVFQSNFDGVQRAFIALSAGVAQWTANGTAYTAMATFTALAFAVIGREFWWADATNRLRKCDTNADPTNENNYTNLIFRVGDQSARITSLMVSAAGTLVIAKTDGLYTLDAAGDDHGLFPFLRFADDQSNGRFWGQFENSLYTSYGYSLGRLQPDLSWEDVGPEKLVNNDSPIRGRVTAFAGVGTMFAYSAIFNPDTSTGYLMKFGAWVSGAQETGADRSAAQHVDAWHGSLSAPLTNQSIQTLFVSSVGAPAAHTRTYLGLSDGSIGWVVNPCVPNPAACTAYRFTVGDAWIQLPTWHGGFHASVKSLRNFAVTGPNLSASNYVTVEYKTDPRASSWTVFANHFDSAVYELSPILPMATTVLAQFRVHLHGAAATASPLLSAFAVGHALRPPRIMQFEGDILCADDLVRRDGVAMRIGRRKIQQYVEMAVDNPGSLTCTLPDETVQELSFIDLKVSQAFDEVGRQWRGSLHVVALQHFTTEIEI